MDDPTQVRRDAVLLLYPTELERRRVEDVGGVHRDLATPFVCGFGVVAAAARTAQLIARHRPRHLVLVGIAGAYDDERHPVGSAHVFKETAIDGVGAGSGASFRGPTSLGFPQWPGSADTGPTPIGESLALAVPTASEASGGLLLTTCAASDSEREAAERRERHPAAHAEDMEGYAVAFAGALEGVPVSIVRGVSNRVGDREPTRWRIPAALTEARRVVVEVLEALRAGGDA